ncbi:hypothetical protein HQ586_10095 [Candidatus Bathyarchaeota archaeon]|nr:hypothetical protein [Candidatus Bathyarchaeota archaeon]
MDESIPIEIGHGRDSSLISLGEFERYLTRFEELLEEMDRRDGGNPRIGATLGIFGGRSLTSTDIEGLLISLEVFEN